MRLQLLRDKRYSLIFDFGKEDEADYNKDCSDGISRAFPMGTFSPTPHDLHVVATGSCCYRKPLDISCHSRQDRILRLGTDAKVGNLGMANLLICMRAIL